jgi:hypothetical protein
MLIVAPSREAWSSTGCNAASAGAFNVSVVNGNVGDKRVSGFLVGDTVTFVITFAGGGCDWDLRPKNLSPLT